MDFRVRSRSGGQAPETRPARDRAVAESSRRKEILMAGFARAASAAALIMAASPVALPQENRTTLSVGADYSTGKYGQSQSTDLLYVPVTAKHETGRWTFKLIVPYLHITGPGNVVGSPDNIVILPGGGAAIRTETG